MTDELTLHDTNRREWLAYVAPNMAAKLASDTDAQVQANWPHIPADYKAAVWALLPDAQRVRIRALREGK